MKFEVFLHIFERVSTSSLNRFGLLVRLTFWLPANTRFVLRICGGFIATLGDQKIANVVLTPRPLSTVQGPNRYVGSGPWRVIVTTGT